MKSSSPAEDHAVASQLSPLAGAALGLVVLPLVYGIFAMLFGWTLSPFLAMPVGVGILLAHVAFLQIRRSSEQLHGLELAIVALVLGYASVALGVLAYGGYYALMRSLGD